MPRNALTLGKIAALAAMLKVVCHKCGRPGRVYTARLLREHGPDKPMPDLVRTHSIRQSHRTAPARLPLRATVAQSPGESSKRPHLLAHKLAELLQ
jgi:hypothetical protein